MVSSKYGKIRTQAIEHIEAARLEPLGIWFKYTEATHMIHSVIIDVVITKETAISQNLFNIVTALIDFAFPSL